jgi:Pentapeptide repeats (8 copies)
MAERLTAEVASSPLQTGASMANDEHVALLKQGVAAWNAWRAENRNIRPNLSGAHLSEENLRGADLSTAILRGAVLRAAKLGKANLPLANLSETDLRWANLSKAKLGKATLSKANLSLTNLSGANLCQANLGGVNLERANLRGADLSGANLWSATLVGTDLTGADLTGCHIYGVSAWGLKLDETTTQKNLIITDRNEPEITVDNIEAGQFLYLLVHNEKIRDIIDTITSKVVLILGRFTVERKAVLDALREELRNRGYLPVLFDFTVPATRDITETISLLARMAKFVVADITDARSIPQELAVIVPDLPSVPVQPLLLQGSDEYGMFEHFKNYPWVLTTYIYASPAQLIADLGERVIRPAENYAL